MKHFNSILLVVFLAALPLISAAQSVDRSKQLDRRVDNQGYWRLAAQLGFTKPNSMVAPIPANYTGSEIRAVSVITEDSPDVVLISGGTSQSENSVAVNPTNYDNALNSNNSTSQPGGGLSLYGANYLYTFDGGLSWDGALQGAGGTNSGDPVALINLDGRYFVGYINNGSGQSLAYSDNQGETWNQRLVANAPSGFGNLLDKNHMWVDNCSTSPYEGYLYDAWTTFGGANNNDIEISRSTDGGDTWSTPQNVSQVINAGSHSQGVNIQTGPNGEVYAVFAIYDGWPSPENAYGLARSFDGGQTYTTARIIENTMGVRNADLGKNMRKNSFPSMAVDISSGSGRGNIYVTWANQGVPGVNSGNDVDIYMIRSEDDGLTWSAPIRINQDPTGLGHKHYFGWISCDPVSGTLSVIFYDDRNVGGAQLEVFCANSFDHGDTWEDFKVSDVSFTPEPIPGLASGYFGDYLGISARGGMVYPVWTDNRTGTALTYTSVYQTSTMTAPTNLTAEVNEETGQVVLSWDHPMGPTFDHFNIYRGLTLLGTTILPTYVDNLPAYGVYRYLVTAYYPTEGESGPAIVDVQWGTANIETNTLEVSQTLAPNSTATAILEITNGGQLPLDFTAGFAPLPVQRETTDYCAASGNGCQEYISLVQLDSIINSSSCDAYMDYTNLSTMLVPGESYTITVNNGSNLYPTDQCAVWIDWNQDGTFATAELVAMSGSPGVGPYTGTFTPPEDALSGQTRMRVRIVRGSAPNPCGSTAQGEVEDYSVDVLGWVTADPLEGTLNAGEMIPVTFSFDSQNMGLGTYDVNFVINSNDPDTPVLPVLIEMQVVDIQLTVTADKYSLCYGGSTTLHAQVTGGSGTFTYSWTSDPPGFISDESDPVVIPEETTTYYVSVADGDFIVEGEVTITVFPLPVVDLGADQASCEGGQATFDAGPGFAGYLWNTGATTQTITTTEPGEYWVEVSTADGCADRDSASFTLFANPMIDLGEDLYFCEGTSMELDGGAGFDGYLWSTGAITQVITVSEAGTYWLLVTDMNGCQDADTIMVTVDPLPGATSVTGGPVSVDTYESTTSDYTASEAADATSYVWTLEPPSAGTFVTDGPNCTVTWADDFTGTATLAITASNSCGNGPASSGYPVQVYSSQGIGESPIRGAKIYPNPSDGSFILELNARRQQEITIRLTAAGGNLVREEKATLTEGLFKKMFLLDRTAKGIYYLTIEGSGGTLPGHVLYRERIVIQ